MDWRNYQPDIQLSEKAAHAIANQVSSNWENNPIGNPDCDWDEEQRRYLAHIVIKSPPPGNLWLLNETDGHYFSVIVETYPKYHSLVLVIEEIDYGHYHRFTHARKNANYVCENCPDDVSRDGKPFGAAL